MTGKKAAFMLRVSEPPPPSVNKAFDFQAVPAEVVEKFPLSKEP